MWKTVKLGDVCTVKTGRKDVNEGSPSGKYPFFTCAKEHTFSDVYSFDCEAILIAGNGAVGQTTYYEGKFEAYQRTYVLSKFHSILPKLLLFILQGRLMPHLSSMVLGNTIPYIKKGMLQNFEFPLPPLAEQQRIVAKLDAAFAEIDTAIEVAEAKEAEVEKLKASLLSASLSADAVMWEAVKLGSVIDVVMGQAPPGAACNKDKIGTPFVKAGEFGDIVPVIREWTTEPKKLGKKTDVFLCVVGATCGKINYGADCAIGRSVAALRPDLDKLNQRLLHYLMSQRVQQLRSGSLGAAQTVISKNMINGISVALPPLAEQKRIVAKLDTAFAEVNSAKQAIQRAKENHAALKGAILAQELTPPTESEAA